MDAETSPTSRVVAAVPAHGATHAEIVRKTGMSREAVDSGLRGAIRARVLRQVEGKYFPARALKRPKDDPLPATCPKPKPKRTPPRMTREEYRQQRKVAERERLALCLALRLEGLNYVQIGSRMGINPGSARKYACMARALRALGEL